MGRKVDTKRFIHNDQLFTDQYHHIYNARLECARASLIEKSRDRWGQVENVPLNAPPRSKDVFVIGTLFKLMPKQGCEPSDIENFTSDEDSLVLQETDENVQVVGDIDIHSHVTGIPVSLLGHQLDGGSKFHATDICYAGPNLDVYKTPMSPKLHDKPIFRDQRLLIVSGLEFGFDINKFKNRSPEIIKGLKKLRDLIMENKSEEQGYKIVKVIIAGNSIAPGYTKAQVELRGSSPSKDSRSLNELVQMFDKYLFSLAQSGADIDIMPGKNDPTSLLLPQQPFHPKILPRSGMLDNVHPKTNPCLMEYKNYIILGTSGENIDAIRKFTRIEFSTTILKNTLEWGHIAPSAPDNLSCVPFKNMDPFLIDFIPDIYFAGNQQEFAVTTYKTETKPKIQLISVPSFVETLSCVTVDLSNLDTELIILGDE